MGLPASERPFNFAGLARPLSEYETARFVVLPVGYEGTVSYQKGTARGPHAILDASRNMELFDEEFRFDTTTVGIHTMEELDLPEGPEAVAGEVGRVVTELLADKKVVAMIGGEHSITYGAVAACRKTFDELCVLQLDAHADLRDEYRGTRFSHACVMRRCLAIAPVTQVGIRSVSDEDAQLIGTDPNVTTYFAHELHASGLARMHHEILSTLTDQVYLTIDIDVFDPAYVPGTGTPEPGGLDWYEVTGLIRALAREKQIVGFDVVEVLPMEGSVVSEFLAAKLTYRTMSCIAEAAGWLKSPQ
jgi:agmatinase